MSCTRHRGSRGTGETARICLRIQPISGGETLDAGVRRPRLIIAGCCVTVAPSGLSPGCREFALIILRAGILGAVASAMLAGCGGELSEDTPPAAIAQTPAPRPLVYHGYFAGSVDIGGIKHFADTILTADGLVRLYVGGPHEPGGNLDMRRPAHAVQFTGSVRVRNAPTQVTATGTGSVIGLTCTPPDIGRFCAGNGTAELNVTGDGETLVGELRISGGPTEVWTLNMWVMPFYYGSASASSSVAGQFRELHAEFATGLDTVINVDRAGRLFFQSPESRCVGNGSLAPHADGRFGVYDVMLRVDSCAAGRAYLNGTFEGLLVLTNSNPWNYDTVMRMWLSTSGAPQTAMSSMGIYVE